jgi:hypothetical protein
MKQNEVNGNDLSQATIERLMFSCVARETQQANKRRQDK